MPAFLPDLSQIQLVRGFFVECAILNDAEDPLLALNALRYSLTNQAAPAFSEVDQEILIDLTIGCKPLDEDGQPMPVSGRFRLHLVFRLSNLADYLTVQPDGSNAPTGDLLLLLISVAYSTARGLIAAKTADTILRNFVLPLLDVRDLVRATPPLEN